MVRDHKRLHRRALARPAGRTVCALLLVGTTRSAETQRAAALFEGDRVRIDAPSLGLRGAEGYAYSLRNDSLRVFFGDRQLTPVAIPRSAVTRIHVASHRSSRDRRAQLGFRIGMVIGAAGALIHCDGQNHSCGGKRGVMLRIAVPAVLGAALAAIPPPYSWHAGDVQFVDRVRPADRDSTSACCRAEPNEYVRVTVPAGIPVKETLGDTVQRLATVFLSLSEALVVDGYTVADSGAAVRATVIAVNGPMLYHEPGEIQLLVSSVRAVDGQELLLGAAISKRGTERERPSLSLRAGHAKLHEGTRIIAFTSVPLTVNILAR